MQRTRTLAKSSFSQRKYLLKIKISLDHIMQAGNCSRADWGNQVNCSATVEKKRDQIRRYFFEFPPCPTLNFSDFVERNLNRFLPFQE